MSGGVSTNGLWIRRFFPAPDAAYRVVCFPHAGGSASFFRLWSQILAPRIEVLSVQYPGRQDRFSDPLLGTVQELAVGAMSALKPWMNKPYLLFGHSMGANVAFEVAQALERRGPGPAALIVSGAAVPAADPVTGVLHLLDDEAFKREVECAGGNIGDVLRDAELAPMILPMLRNDYCAAESYWAPPEALVHCRVLGLLGSADPLVNCEEAGRWRGRTTNLFDCEIIPGDHFALSGLDQNFLKKMFGRLVGSTWY